jgi:hypothetical protein
MGGDGGGRRRAHLLPREPTRHFLERAPQQRDAQIRVGRRRVHWEEHMRVTDGFEDGLLRRPRRRRLPGQTGRVRRERAQREATR